MIITTKGKCDVRAPLHSSAVSSLSLPQAAMPAAEPIPTVYPRFFLSLRILIDRTDTKDDLEWSKDISA